jgi:hypothetical protein
MPTQVDLYGKYKAKVKLSVKERLAHVQNGNLGVSLGLQTFASAFSACSTVAQSKGIFALMPLMPLVPPCRGCAPAAVVVAGITPTPLGGG